MMKKEFSLVMICFTLLLYLLHAAIPHHHHQEAICFQLHCLEHCDADHHHDGTCHHHSPDECQIFSSLAITENDDKQLDCAAYTQNDTDNQHNTNTGIILSSDLNLSSILTFSFQYVVQDETTWCLSPRLPNGLRAPPIA